MVKNALPACEGGQPVRSEPLPSTLHGVLEIGDPEVEAVTGVLRSKKIFRFLRSDEESYAARFEKRFAEFVGTRHALAVTGGTTALISALVGLGVSTGDEVIVPAYTYIATPAAVLDVGAIPVIAEVDDTLTIDPEDIQRKITPLTRCILPVHMRGLPAQMDRILEVAGKHDLDVLEDTAQAVGGEYRGQKLGSFGRAGIFSFQHYKVITSGEGGMVVTNEEEVFQRAAHKHDSAMSFWRGEGGVKPFAGQNNRMCELRAAVGYVQMDRLEGILETTRRLKRMIVEGIRGLPGLTIQRVADEAGDCGLAVIVYLDSPQEARRFSGALEKEGIRCGTIYNKGVPDRHIYRYWDYVMHKRTHDRTGYPWDARYYKGNVEYSEDMCPATLDYLGRAVTIGLGQQFDEGDARDIITAVTRIAEHYYG